MNKEKTIQIVETGFTNTMVTSCAELYCQVWQEPPWNENFWQAETIAGTIREILNRPGAITLMAQNDNQVVGFTWGFLVDRAALREITGGPDLDILFREQNQVFYIAELGVASQARHRKIGARLTGQLLAKVRQQKIPIVVLRTDLSAKPARALYQSLSFQEMPIFDKDCPNRTYWIRRF